MNNIIQQIVDNLDNKIEKAIEFVPKTFGKKEIGIVDEVKDSVIVAVGFTKVFNQECVMIADKYAGIVSSLDEDYVKIILLDKTSEVRIGDTIKRTFKPFAVPVGDALIGRIVDGLGKPLDDLGEIKTPHIYPAERPSHPISHRSPVEVSLETGIKIVDAMIPIGMGQRELILGDRQTGKTSIAVDTILQQKGKNVICIYCAIGQKDSAIANVIAKLKSEKVMDYTIVMKAGSNELSGHQFIAPYSATAMAEYFMEHGKNVLIVYDDLTKHARAYRELSLLLERTPGREAFPGDIFYIHSRLLERSTRLKDSLGGGSITALPIVETELGNMASYIPTNAISITDGQIYLSAEYFQKGLLPAIEIRKSVSRVGHQAQVKSYKEISQIISVAYSQFKEMEMFLKFSTKLDEHTHKIMSRGKKISEVLKQDRYYHIPTEEQIGIFLCVNHGLFDDVQDKYIRDLEQLIQKTVQKEFRSMVKIIRADKSLPSQIVDKFIANVKEKIDKTEWRV